MITRSLSTTPFGLRLTYSIDGEHTWTEYIRCSSTINLQEHRVKKTRQWAEFFSHPIKTMRKCAA